jgi:hypothetical protein
MITTLHVAQRNLFETEASQVLPPICRLTSTIGSSHIISKPKLTTARRRWTLHHCPAAAGRWVPQVPRIWGPGIAQAPYLPTPRALHGLCTSQHCGCPRSLALGDLGLRRHPTSPLPAPSTDSAHHNTVGAPGPPIWGPGIAQAPYLPTPRPLHGLCTSQHCGCPRSLAFGDLGLPRHPTSPLPAPSTDSAHHNTVGAPGPSHLGTWDCPGTLPPHSFCPPRTPHITTLWVPQVPRIWGPGIAQAPYLPTPFALHGLRTSQHCGCPRSLAFGDLGLRRHPTSPLPAPSTDSAHHNTVGAPGPSHLGTWDCAGTLPPHSFCPPRTLRL